jgi:hypothetical protein
MEQKELHSYHLFLFPFQWDFLPAGKVKTDCDFESRSSLRECEKALQRNPYWKHNPYVIGEETSANTDYNEFTFFYDFVRKTIFDYEDPSDKNDRLNYYSYHTPTNGYYRINLARGKSFQLEIISVSLHLFNTGVGILNFNLKNTRYSSKEDILLINEFGRRIYPQFLGKENGDKGALFTAATKQAFLADSIQVDYSDGHGVIEEDFSYFNDVANLRAACFRLPNHIRHLFEGTGFTEVDKKYTNRILVSNIMDDRMFTMCWYGNDAVSNQLQTKWDKDDYPYKSNKWWYSFVMCDSNGDWPTVQNAKLLEDYLDRHTYQRWTNYGTLYGVSKESFMLLTSGKHTLEKNAPPLDDHLRTMYFQIVVLCLACRASMLRFSGEVSRLTDLALHHRMSERRFFRPIEKLYENYIEFLNKIHFREVTTQVQGIELYNMLYRHMNLENQIKDLDSELQELHDFVAMRREKQRNDSAQMLNWLAAIFLPMTVVAGFFGANFNDHELQGLSQKSGNAFWLLVAISFASSFLVLILVHIIQYFKKR